MLHVLAAIHLTPGSRDAFVAEFNRLRPLVLAEEGCIEYVGAMDVPTGIAVQAPVRDDVLMVIEKWESEAALAAHGASAHMAEHRERSRGLTSGTVIHVLETV